jgi:hypothetical protein
MGINQKEDTLMKCPKCGMENNDQAKICQGCGTDLQMPAQQPEVKSISIKMDSRLLGLIGLIAGIIALVGIFLHWVNVSGWGMSFGASAWDSVTNATVVGEEVGREAWACIAFSGAVLAVAGALSALVLPGKKILWGILALGSLLAIIGASWGFSDTETGNIMGLSVSYGAGVYMTLIGGIFGLIGAIVGLLKVKA